MEHFLLDLLTLKQQKNANPHSVPVPVSDSKREVGLAKSKAAKVSQ